MTMNGWMGRLLLLSLIASLIVVNMVAAQTITYPCQTHARMGAQSFLGAVVGSLGEFRPLVADYCSLYADQVWHEGRWYLVPRMYELIVDVQPSYVEYWGLLGWFYAFNTPTYLKTADEKRAAIDTGIAQLMRGLRYHPERWQLYFELAWIYYKQLKDIPRAREYAYQSVRYAPPFRAVKLAALLAYRTGEKEKAVALWEQYLVDHPGNSKAHDELRIVSRNRKTVAV